MIRKLLVKIEGEVYEVNLIGQNHGIFLFTINGKKVEAEVLPVKPSLPEPDTQDKPDGIERAPFVGVVGKIFVKDGDTVQRGQILLTIEAMKMENAIRAKKDGIVQSVKVCQGQKVDRGEELVFINYSD